MSDTVVLKSIPNIDQTRVDQPTSARRLRVAFVITSMPIGGAETLLVNLVRGFTPERFEPEIVCLKEPGPLGLEIAKEFPLSHSYLYGKYDFGVLRRLVKHFRQRRIDAVITVGAGDKMFWGRLAAKFAGVSCIASALHSTGWPDGVGKVNRLLTPITDAFIAVADSHGKFMVDFERFPPTKVAVIRNGIDTKRFIPSQPARDKVRKSLGLSTEKQLVGIVAALRTEKNHRLFVEVASQVNRILPEVHFLIIGEGPERASIESSIEEFKLSDRVHLLGSRLDTPELVASLDAFLLTSHNEANPVSILEALACEVPVVSSRVGSIAETVRDGETGFTFPAGDCESATKHLLTLLLDSRNAKRLGKNGRKLVEESGSLHSMVRGYEELVERILASKR